MSKGAPIGNQFWKQRSKHGRDKIFKTPQDLWDAACEYFESIDNNPYHKAEAKTVNIGDYQSQVEIVSLPVMKPYTIQGLCRFLDTNTGFFNEFEQAEKAKKTKEAKDFSVILTRIREIIYEQKFSGAASGFFNGNLITRDLGIADKKEIEKKVTQLNFKNAE